MHDIGVMVMMLSMTGVVIDAINGASPFIFTFFISFLMGIALTDLEYTK